MTNWIEYVVSSLRRAGRYDALNDLVARINADAADAAKRGDAETARVFQKTGEAFTREIERRDTSALLEKLRESADRRYPGVASMQAAIDRFAAQVEGREPPPVPEPQSPGFLAQIAEEHLKENPADDRN